jgi:hypothetical protein
MEGLFKMINSENNYSSLKKQRQNAVIEKHNLAAEFGNHIRPQLTKGSLKIGKFQIGCKPQLRKHFVVS